MLRLFAVTPQTQLSAPTVPPRSDTMSRDALSDRNNLAPRPMTSIHFNANQYDSNDITLSTNSILGYRTCVAHTHTFTTFYIYSDLARTP